MSQQTMKERYEYDGNRYTPDGRKILEEDRDVLAHFGFTILGMIPGLHLRSRIWLDVGGDIRLGDSAAVQFLDVLYAARRQGVVVDLYTGTVGRDPEMVT